MKVRGHRVELEEVESVLRKCPGIAEAAVCATTSPGLAEADSGKGTLSGPVVLFAEIPAPLRGQTCGFRQPSEGRCESNRASAELCGQDAARSHGATPCFRARPRGGSCPLPSQGMSLKREAASLQLSLKP